MKVLLTGSKGFIGTQVGNWLASEKIKFTGMDAGDSIPEDKFDIVLHFGARTLIRKSKEFPYEYFLDNMDFTLRILEKCRRDGSSIVFPTSGSVMEATNPYSLSKKQGEEWVRMYSTLYGVRAYILKLFNIYGETSRKGAVYLFCNAAVNNETAIIYGDGSHLRDYVHVGDLVKFIASIVAGEISPGSYEIGTGVGTSVEGLLRIVEKVSGRKITVEKKEYVLPEADELFARNSSLRQPLNIEEGVLRILSVLEEHGRSD